LSTLQLPGSGGNTTNETWTWTSSTSFAVAGANAILEAPLRVTDYDDVTLVEVLDGDVAAP
jgi:hypothetical protein